MVFHLSNMERKGYTSLVTSIVTYVRLRLSATRFVTKGGVGYGVDETQKARWTETHAKTYQMSRQQRNNRVLDPWKSFGRNV